MGSNKTILFHRIGAIVLFLFLLGAVLFALSNISQAHPDKLLRAKNVRVLLEQGPYDVVFIGNSHLAYAVAPVIVNDIVPDVNTVSLSFYPSALLEYYPVVRELVTMETPPSVIMLETYTFPNHDTSLFWRILPQNNFWFLPQIIANTTPDQHLPILNRFLRSHEIWQDGKTMLSYFQSIFTPPLDAESLTQYGNPDGAMFINFSVMGQKKYRGSYQLSPGQYEDSISWQLALIADLCKKHGVTLILVEVPTVNEWGLADERTHALAQELELQYFDYNEIIPRNEDFGRVIFSNRDNPQADLNSHLSPQGAILTSSYIAATLAAELDLAVDDARLRQYQEIILRDIRMDGLDQDFHPLQGMEYVTVEVIPFRVETPVLFEWKVVNDTESKVVLYQAPSPGNKIQIPAAFWNQDHSMRLILHHPVLEGGSLELRIPMD